MPIIVSDGFAERGKQDARRHRDKIQDSIKKQLPDIISQESIITGSRKGRKVKVPIRSLDIPYFRSGKKGRGIGVGQGEGDIHDVIGKRSGSKGSNKPGDKPGDDYLETEIDLEEIIQMMMEDLGLPRLEEKEMREIEVVLGFKIKGRQMSGIPPLLDRNASYKNGIKRFWSFLGYLKEEGLKQSPVKDELVCFTALKRVNGDLGQALELVRDQSFTEKDRDLIQPFPIFEQGDLRYRKLEDDIALQSNAVMIAMMDVSGSMTIMKKYLARSILFWLVEFLRKIYHKVDVRFIIHHATAKLVDEETCFKTAESGGTCSHTAFDLASELVDSEYPPSAWNIYGFYFSDGEDFDTDKTIESIKIFLAKGINMLGYAEICPGEDLIGGFSVLLTTIIKSFHLISHKNKENKGLETVSGGKNLPFLGMKIRSKENILPALKEFLKKDRWVE